ncbi:MAG: thioesterase family protein [Bdellovibrionota bacterium]
MSYRLRLILRILSWLGPPYLDISKEYRGEYRVWPTEAEWRVVENARYGYFLVLERFRFVFCSVLWKICLRRGWTAVMGTQIYKVKRPLHRWQKFSVITKPLCWDDKWFYFEQRIESSEKLVCSAVISCIFLAKDRKIPTAEILQLTGVTAPSPPFSEALKKFIMAEQALET